MAKSHSSPTDNYWLEGYEEGLRDANLAYQDLLHALELERNFYRNRIKRVVEFLEIENFTVTERGHIMDEDAVEELYKLYEHIRKRPKRAQL